MSKFVPGSKVLVRTANKQLLPRRAITGVVSGSDFPIVWVCREEAWRADLAVEDAEAVAWPAEAVVAYGDGDGRQEAV